MWNFGHCDLPFDFAQGGQLVEPFDIWDLLFGISIPPLLQKSSQLKSLGHIFMPPPEDAAPDGHRCKPLASHHMLSCSERYASACSCIESGVHDQREEV